jgi:mannose-6-phosphate isomerase
MDSIKPSQFVRPIRLQVDNFSDNQWGGDWIVRLKSLPPAPGPVGESWEFSAHPSRPSRLPELGVTLRDALQRAAPAILGESVARRLGGEPPFLLKFIDSREDLSVQVHPDDFYARAREGDLGKAESWVILDADHAPGNGYIYVGFDPRRAEGFSDNAAFAEAFLSAISEANAQGPTDDPALRARTERLILPYLNRIPVRAGEVYDLRPGTIHAIGRGVRLFEIQQSSDVTYRVWDWNRPDSKKLKEGIREFRPLHLAQAKDVLNFRPSSPEHYRRTPVELKADGDGRRGLWSLVTDAGGRYVAERLRVEKESRLVLPAGFCVLTVTSGAVMIECGGAAWGEVNQGASVLIPAAAPGLRISSRAGTAELIRSRLPD